MIRICIVEDDVLQAQKLEEFLFRYAKENGHDIIVSQYQNAEVFLNNYKSDCALVFMDIELPGINGLDAIKKIREKDDKVVVVFVTQLLQYAINGYSVHAFDYIVKPIGYYEIALKLKNIFAHLQDFRKVSIVTSSRQGKRIIDISDLKYVEVNKHDIIYHTVQENILCSGTLKQVCDELKDAPFALCNQCYLVNLRYVKGIKGNICYLDDEELTISAPKRKPFFNALTQYVTIGKKY